MTDTITVVGNIATNPDHRTAGAVPVTSFRVATSERRIDPQGTWVDAHTNYYTVSAFRSLAEHAFASLRRGDRVIVTGRLRLKDWTGADGSKGRTIEIDADALGHDLRFGTTVFQRGSRGDATTAETPVSSEWSGDGSTSDAWALSVEQTVDADGSSIDETLDPTETSPDSRPLALAGAGTPF